jgi:hypothetical protein
MSADPDAGSARRSVAIQFAGCGLSAGHFAKQWGMPQRAILFADLALYSCPMTYAARVRAAATADR